MSKTFCEYGIDTKGKTFGEIKTICPRCSQSRKKKNDPCLGVNIGKGVWKCHHCDFSGNLGRDDMSYKKYTKPVFKKPEHSNQSTLSEKARKYLLNRGLTDIVLDRNKITSGLEWMPQVGKEVSAIRFPYFKNGEAINIKFRDGEKNFKMVKDAEITLYGFDDIEGDTLIWVEGEIDKLSCEVAGFKSCVSVPAGAADKLKFLENCFPRIVDIKTHIIAVDNDTAGELLKNTIIKRVGPEKCKTVSWPPACKDFNDVLIKGGAGDVKTIINKARFVKLAGLFDARDSVNDVLDFYENGFERGCKIGFSGLDDLYSVKPGEWTVITGAPSSGKSEFVDAMMVNLAEEYGWKFGVCSPENQPIEFHISKLMEKHLRKPFLDGPRNRIPKEEVLPGVEWVDNHFSFILPNENQWSVVGILELADKLVYRKGINALIIDPWNELDHSRPTGFSETEYISASLSKIRRFARERGIHIWITAHPTKLKKQDDGTYPVATLYDIAGSAHWRNKADNGISVYRDMSEPTNPMVQIHVQKIRFKWNGQEGMAQLTFDRVTGRYSDYVG